MHFDESKMKKQRVKKGNPYSLQPDLQHVQKEKVEQLIILAKQYYKYETFFKREKFFSRQQYYLICSKWLKRWKIYVSYNEVIKDKNQNKLIGCGKLSKANQSIIESIYFGSLQFQGNLQYLKIKLKAGLQQEKDYQFISKQMYECLLKCKDYEMNKIIRKVVMTKDGKKVQLYPFSFKVIILFNDHCKIIERNEFQKFIEANFQFSLYSKVEDFTSTLQNYFKQTIKEAYKSKTSDPPKFSVQDNTRVWLLSQDIQKNIYFNILREACRKNLRYEYKIYFDGLYLQRQSYLCDYQINETSYLVIEFRESGQQNWIFFNEKYPLQANCPNCSNKKLLKVFCSCKLVAYCSQQCKKKQKQYHKGRCPNEAQSDEEQNKKLVLVQQSKKGLVGLRNLGNTCFMNSGLQCISNIAQLRDYFLKDSYIKDINKVNKLGTKGQLSTSFAKMVQKMWFGTDSYFSPANIKTAIAKFQPMFSGYNQHDSGELINYLLDGLHEDLNRIKQRPYIQIKDYDGRPDQIIANQVWSIFLKRNQSIIVDLMYGQYKSIVDCPKCTFKSIQFDPFLMLSLPLSNANKKTIKVIYLKNHFSEKLLKITYFISKKPTFQYIFDQIRQQLNLQRNKKLIAFAGSSSKCKFIPEDTDVDSYVSELYYSKIYIRQLLDEQNYEKDNYIAIYNAAKYTYASSRRTFSAPRLYFCNKKMTMKEIHLFIAKLCSLICPFKNYEKEVLNQEKSEKPFQILYQTGRMARKCQLCGSGRCQGCQLKFNDDKLPEERQNTTAIELHVQWLKDYKQMKSKIEQLEAPDGRDGSEQKQNAVQLDQCLNLFKEPETLAQDNAWYCPKCKQFVLANKQMSIYKAPKILLITLKRFKRRGYSSDKNSVVVNYPITGLDLSSYVASYGANRKGSKANKTKVQQGMIYDLIGVSNHFGSTSGGHYTAYCKNSSTNQWYQFDDSTVQKIKDQSSIVSKAGYVLFYRRRQ